MRRRRLQLMTLAAALLTTASGGIADPLPDPPITLANPEQGRASTIATGPEEASPPAARPEPGPSALEASEATEVVPLTTALRGVVKLLRAGVEEDVLLKHIETSSEPFDVGTDEIVFLTDLGASGRVIKAMMERDQQIRSDQGSTATQPQLRSPWPAAGTVEEVPAPGSTATVTPPLSPTIETTAVVEAPTEPVTVNYFYQQLAPYGAWIDVPGYGLCWQPTVAVASPGWMPYADRGRWVYTDCGWYWYSHYSWGWGPFHYGRWFHHTRWGWCWAPGTIWGPSWVSWRYADGYCGWAPLPPCSSSGFYFSIGISWSIPSWCYTYVPSHRICTDYPRKHALPYAQARPIHDRSSLRDHYTVGRNDTIVNRGIPPEDLTGNPARDIRRAQINERHSPPTGSTRRENFNSDNTAITVYKPRGARTVSRDDPTVLHPERHAPTRTVGTSTVGNGQHRRNQTESASRTRAPAPSIRTEHAVEHRPDSSLVIRGQREAARTPPLSRAVETPSPDRSPPARPAARRDTSTAVGQSMAPAKPSSSTAPSRSWNTRVPSPRPSPTLQTRPTPSSTATPTTPIASTPPVVSPRSSPPPTMRSPSVSGQASGGRNPRGLGLPTASRPTTPKPEVNRSASPFLTPQRAQPAVQPARPAVRSAPRANPAPRPAPSYSPPTSSSSKAPAAPRAAPRSSPPGRSSGGRGNSNR